jgi:regulator of RNase E activity RraA
MNDLGGLAAISVPTLANALETFAIQAPNTGYTGPALACHIQPASTVVGYAATVIATTDRPSPQPIDEHDYWTWLRDRPNPKVIVLADLDDPPAGAMWGEWNANVHIALGAAAVVVHGAVRDLDALERLGLPTFATAVSVAHGCGALVDYGAPVTVAGLLIGSGDLLAADRHGVLRIPDNVPITELIARAKTIDALEAEVFAYCQSGGLTPDGMAELQRSVEARWPGGSPPTTTVH